MLTNVLGADKPLWQGEDDDWLGWWQLAVAYERKGNTAEALLATARKLFYSGGAKDIQRSPDLRQARPADFYPRVARLADCRGHRHLQDPSLSRLAQHRNASTATEGMPMPARPPASLIDALASLKGAALLVPAILLVGATLALGQSSAPSSTPTPPACRHDRAGRAAPASPPDASTSAFTPAQRKELETIIKEVLLNNPEIMLEVQNALEVQDGQDPGRAHGGGHQGARRRALPAGRLRPSSATPRATCR